MYPSKSMVDYMTEMNRLFPRNLGEDVFQTPNSIGNLPSPFAPAMANRSSSSADSISPDTFPDLASHRLTSEMSLAATYRQTSDTSLPYDTPLIIRRQRPIVGRKILGSSSDSYTPKSHESDSNMWSIEESPPRGRHCNYPPSYELFPTEQRNLEFRTPVKTYTPSTMSPNFSNSSNISPITANTSPLSNMHIPRYPTAQTPPYLIQAPSTSKFGQEVGPTRMCTFCRKNGETPLMYMTHMVKERVGNRQIVTCPILRKHVCSTCGSSGDNAHTITYCPVLRSTNNGQPLQSTTIILKNTRIKSNGRRRY